MQAIDELIHKRGAGDDVERGRKEDGGIKQEHTSIKELYLHLHN